MGIVKATIENLRKTGHEGNEFRDDSQMYDLRQGVTGKINTFVGTLAPLQDWYARPLGEYSSGGS